ncbi:hypothetical protein BN2497_2465 [Janthinobacterium sp. CG23_2]|nr:hypothetical protein BN2497_2465 [Janthinobacterium sp. CG23_2]CUU27630.1 hypothetical protein BN3177_2465 [Janthinobacterium sp. CG23_2]
MAQAREDDGDDESGSVSGGDGGTYHAFDVDKYGFLYLAEAQYRFNRRFDLSTMLTRL